MQYLRYTLVSVVLFFFNEEVSLLLDEQNVEMQIHGDVAKSTHFAYANDISEGRKITRRRKYTHNDFIL